jgi:hypothetical protein
MTNDDPENPPPAPAPLKGADIEAAMAEAIRQAALDGVSDAEELRQLMQEARERAVGKR